MPSKDRVIEIFIAAVHRKPEAKDMLAINGMAKPYIDELAIKETFEGLYAGEQETIKREADPVLILNDTHEILQNCEIIPCAQQEPLTPLQTRGHEITEPVVPKPESKPGVVRNVFRKNREKKTTESVVPEKTQKNYKKIKAKSITAKKIKSMAKSKTKAKVKAKRKPKKW